MDKDEFLKLKEQAIKYLTHCKTILLTFDRIQLALGYDQTIIMINHGHDLIDDWNDKINDASCKGDHQ